MSIVKTKLYEDYLCDEDLYEYELYCYYQDMKDKWLGEEDPLDHFRELMEDV